MPDLGDGGGRPEVGYDADTGPAAYQDPSPAAVRCEGGLSVLFSVLLLPWSQALASVGASGATPQPSTT
jgi:hypothetical protein